MKKTVDEFIEKAKLMHEDKYDYTLVEYVNAKTKVKIICPIHGVFEKTPNNHTNKSNPQGCSFCGFKKNANNRLSKDFIEKAKLIHNEDYDYSLVEYKRANIKVEIICNKCREVFKQTPGNHLSGQGCPNCSSTKKKSTEQFIHNAKLIHNEDYDYSLVEYVNAKTKVKIICNSCKNIFEQAPSNHISKIHPQGCPNCYGNTVKTTEQFIKKSIDIWGIDKYDYSLVRYKNNREKVKIICNEHGLFEQSPKKHYLGEGCPGCKLKSKGENKIEKILTNKNIHFEKGKKYDDLRDKKPLSYDFYLLDFNLLIEYNGEQHYENVFDKPLHDFHRQLHHDWLKRKYAMDNNIKLIVIPYWDYDNIEKILEEIKIG